MGFKTGTVLVGKQIPDGETAEAAANLYYPEVTSHIIENQGERGYVIMVPKRYAREKAKWKQIGENPETGLIKL